MAVAGRLRGRVRICLRCRIGFYRRIFKRVFLLLKTDCFGKCGRSAVGGSGGGGRAGRLGVAVGVWAGVI